MLQAAMRAASLVARYGPMAKTTPSKSVPQNTHATQPCRVGAAPNLGLRYHLRTGPDQFSAGPVDAAAHDHGRCLQRVWSRPEHRQREGPRHFAGAKDSSTRSKMVAAEFSGCQPTRLDG